MLLETTTLYLTLRLVTQVSLFYEFLEGLGEDEDE